MDTIFMNSEKSKTTEPYRLLLDLSDKIDLKSVPLSKLCIYNTWKNTKNHTIAINLKYQFLVELKIWTTWWDIFYIGHSRLFWVHHQINLQK